MLSFSKTYPPTSESEINDFEQKWNINLPENYKNFLLENNGGRPAEDLTFPIKNDPPLNLGVINFFYGINAGEHNDLDKEMRVHEDRVPKGFVPIAGDPMGNEICLAVSGEHEGEVYFWEHEEEAEDGEEPTMQNMYLVANSFEEFLNNLKPYEEDDSVA